MKIRIISLLAIVALITGSFAASAVSIDPVIAEKRDTTIRALGPQATPSPAEEASWALLDEMIAEHGDNVYWPYELHAEWDEKSYEMGATDVRTFGLPGPGQVTENEAIQAATAAMQEKYALTDETLARFVTPTKFLIEDPENPVWMVDFYPAVDGDYAEIGSYFLKVHADTGEVVEVLSSADGVG